MLEPVSRLSPQQPPKLWEFQERRASGIFLASRSGALLCRIEPPFTIFLWDKKAGVEVAVDVRDLPIWGAVGNAH
jgi:hypothetical protein